MTEQQQIVFNELNQMNIQYEVENHQAVYTIEDMEKIHICNRGEVPKNLFLRNANGKQHYLVVLQKDKNVDLKNLRSKIGSSALSFASEDRLNEHLGLAKGSVSPLGLLNNADCSVELIFDECLKDVQRIGVHPNENTATVWITPSDLSKVILEHGNKITYLDI